MLLFQADGFPTLLFFPAGNKSSEPVSFSKIFQDYCFVMFAASVVNLIGMG